MPNAPIPYTYATLTQAMQDWPVNQGANYVANIPQFISLGELRLLRDLNLEFFDAVDSTQVLAAGANVVTKPANIVSLRTMRLAQGIAQTAQAASANSVGLSQITSQAPFTLVFNGALGAAPVTLAIPRQVTITDTSGAGYASGGVIVTVGGTDSSGSVTSETIYARNASTVTGKTLWSVISSLTCSGGSQTQTISIGTAAAAASTLGRSWPVYKRNYDYVSNYAANPARVERPRYYAELSATQWVLSQATDQGYTVVVRFIERPASITTLGPTGTTWLSQNCSDLLFQCSLMEAENYLKADDRFGDISADYASKLQVARIELRNSIRQGDYSPVKAAAETVQG
jgi:hypothetical protein